MNNNGYVQILFSALFLVQGSFADLYSPLPNNVAASKGATDVVMSCSSTLSSNVIGWSYVRVGGSSEELIAFGSTVYPPYDQTYTVVAVGTNQSNLGIKRVTESVAGTYICTEGPTRKSALAQFIVIDSDPMCNVNPSVPNELNYGQVVNMSNSISYYGNGSYVSAKMVWLPDASAATTPLNVTTSGNLTAATSTITPSAGYSSPFPVYSCTTSFNITPSSGMANNAFNYSKVCRPFSSPIPVIYLRPANDSTITGAKSEDRVYQGTKITCIVDANPPANYSWLDKTYVNTTNSSSIQIWHDGEYQCTAWNRAGSTSASINLTTYITTTTSTTTLSTTTVNSSITTGASGARDATEMPPPNGGGLTDTDKIIIGVVIGVGVPLLIAIAVGIYCCVKKSKGGKPHKPTSQPRSNNAIPPPYSESYPGPQRASNPDVVNVQMNNIHPPYSQVQRPNDGRHTHYIVEDDEGLNYAQLAVDNNPRSRLPLQMKDDPNSAYADIQRA